MIPPCFIEGLADELGRQETRVPTRSPVTHQLVRIAMPPSPAKLCLDAQAESGDDRPDCIAVAALERGRVCRLVIRGRATAQIPEYIKVGLPVS